MFNYQPSTTERPTGAHVSQQTNNKLLHAAMTDDCAKKHATKFHVLVTKTLNYDIKHQRISLVQTALHSWTKCK